MPSIVVDLGAICSGGGFPLLTVGSYLVNTGCQKQSNTLLHLFKEKRDTSMIGAALTLALQFWETVGADTGS